MGREREEEREISGNHVVILNRTQKEKKSIVENMEERENERKKRHNGTKEKTKTNEHDMK